MGRGVHGDAAVLHRLEANTETVWPANGGQLSSLTITTPAPDQVSGVEGISVHAGAWRVEASVDGIPLA